MDDVHPCGVQREIFCDSQPCIAVQPGGHVKAVDPFNGDSCGRKGRCR